MKLTPPQHQKVYFASDFHLGVPDKETSRQREWKIIRWLDKCKKDAHAIFLVGDLFDFWFEYKSTVPKGFCRFLGKLSEITDSGILLVIFTGNHDLWTFGYLEEELGAKVIHNPIQLFLGDTKIFIGHGDGIGPADKAHKMLKKIFKSKFFQWCFRRLHPNTGIALANFCSRRSRLNSNETGQHFLGNKEWLWTFCKETESKEHHDYYIFGHRHLPLDLEVGQHSRYINLGEWLSNYTYAVYETGKVRLETFSQ